MRNARKWFLATAGVLALSVLVHILEPFSARFEGRTARQWLSFYSSAKRLPERAVVAHFGSSAIPLLLQESRPSGLFSATLALERFVNSRVLDELRAEDFDRRLACHDWALLLLDLQPDVLARALASETEVERGLQLTRLFCGDRQLGATLKRYSAQTTNRILQARAETLLDAYRSLN